MTETISSLTEDEIRADERARLSALLTDNAETLGSFGRDGEATVRLIAYMLTLRP